MSFSSEDDRRLLLLFIEWLTRFDDWRQIHPAELVGAFMAEREQQRGQQWSVANED